VLAHAPLPHVLGLERVGDVADTVIHKRYLSVEIVLTLERKIVHGDKVRWCFDGGVRVVESDVEEEGDGRVFFVLLNHVNSAVAEQIPSVPAQKR
jgi:hypothetical protein